MCADSLNSSLEQWPRTVLGLRVVCTAHAEGGGRSIPDDVGVSTAGGSVQRRPSLLVLDVQVGLQLHQSLHHGVVIVYTALEGGGEGGGRGRKGR